MKELGLSRLHRINNMKNNKKMMQDRKKAAGFMIALFAILLLSGSAFAFGVGSQYWKENPLAMHPGETKDVYLELQNMVGNEDLTMKARVINGSEIAQLSDSSDSYVVPAGTRDVKVNIKVSIPENAQPGDRYNVGLSFYTIKSSTAGQFNLGTGIDKYFDVVVEEAPEPSAGSNNSSSPILWIVVALVGVALIYYIVRRKADAR